MLGCAPHDKILGTMNRESIREYCLALPHATEMVQWGDHLLFKVGGKMFAVMALDPDEVVLSFKATPDQFYELQEQDGIVPAPYMARNQWLALERFDALRDDELKELLARSHGLVYEKLPKRVKQELSSIGNAHGRRLKKSAKASSAPRTPKSRK
jgi:predicted DNA-binding protein (MmcQ/YjbR family)